LSGKQLLETLHFLGFAPQIGAIMVMSIRLLGFGRRVPIAALERPVFAIAWLGFTLVLVTGVLQLIPIAAEILHRPSFRAKIALLTLALGGCLWMHMKTRRDAAAWDAGGAVPRSLKAVAVFSLLMWPAVVIVARLMYAIVQMEDL
jgi:hypothetical protein